MQKLTLLFLLAFWGLAVYGQEDHRAAQVHSSTHEETYKNFRLAVLIGHTSVPSRENPDHLFIPSWGFDVEYWFSRKLGLGIHNDIELQSFLVEGNHEMTLEREYPLVLTLDLLYKPVGDLVLLAGPGYELEKMEDYKLIRFGVEYEFEFGNHWDISPTLFYDTRMNAYDTWSIALGVGKRF